jgi:hypothetical protein
MLLTISTRKRYRENFEWGSGKPRRKKTLPSTFNPAAVWISACVISQRVHGNSFELWSEKPPALHMAG